MSAEDYIGGEETPKEHRERKRYMKTVTGVFELEKKKCSNGNYRTIVKNSDDKQVASTFDLGLSDRLFAIDKGTVLTLTIDDSQQYWELVDVQVADKPAGTPAKKTARKDAPEETTDDTSNDSGMFVTRDMTYFMGNSARIVAALIAADEEYRDTLRETGNVIVAAHKDIVIGAFTLLNEANKIS